jgi:hypothetical protein
MATYNRPILSKLVQRLAEPRRFLQVMAGPRQVGKTTLARQLMDSFGTDSSYASADSIAPNDRIWIEQQWEAARLRCRQTGRWLLVLDEVQKVPGWSEMVKRL